MLNYNINKRPYKVIIESPRKIENINNKSNIIKRPDINYSATIKNIKSNIKKFRNYEKIGRIDPIFKNETIYIIGGGPSLKNFDFNRLKDKRTIVINKGFYSVPRADVLYWTDYRVYNWYHKDIDLFKGLKITNKPTPIKDDIINLLTTGKTGLEYNNNGLRHGNNSGYAAINLAYHLGAKTIILLGFDMKETVSNSHWHDGYNIPKTRPNLYSSSMIPNFETLVEPLKNANIDIINANIDSELRCFKRIPLEEVLAKY